MITRPTLKGLNTLRARVSHTWHGCSVFDPPGVARYAIHDPWAAPTAMRRWPLTGSRCAAHRTNSICCTHISFLSWTGVATC